MACPLRALRAVTHDLISFTKHCNSKDSALVKTSLNILKNPCVLRCK